MHGKKGKIEKPANFVAFFVNIMDHEHGIKIDSYGIPQPKKKNQKE